VPYSEGSLLDETISESASFLTAVFSACRIPIHGSLVGRAKPVNEGQMKNWPTENALRTLKTGAGTILRNVSNVLSDEKKQQVIALGRLAARGETGCFHAVTEII
jgi:hypothetical protein